MRSAVTDRHVGGRALRSSPVRAHWVQDESGDWWYVMPTARRVGRATTGLRVRGGWRMCVGCDRSFLAVHSRRQRYCRKGCATVASNERRSAQAGSTTATPQGYVLERVSEDDPFRGMGRNGKKNGRWILQHRLVVARALGRPLASHESVHHLNGDRTDNQLENLQLRSGPHGTGQVAHCADCGSTHVTFEEV